jgi:hypothetical protein
MFGPRSAERATKALDGADVADVAAGSHSICSRYFAVARAALGDREGSLDANAITQSPTTLL